MDNQIEPQANNQVPTSSPSPEPVKTNRFIKYRYIIYAGVILLFAAIMAAVFWKPWVQSPEDPGTSNENPQDNAATKDWPTFVNEQYGFSFKYPKEWAEPKLVMHEVGGLMSVVLGCPEVETTAGKMCPLSVHVAKTGDKELFLKNSYLFNTYSKHSSGEISRYSVGGLEVASFNINTDGKGMATNYVVFGNNYFYLVKDDGLVYQNNEIIKNVLGSFETTNPVSFSTNSVTGSLKKLDDLKLFKATSQNEEYSYTPVTVYYESGVIQTGKYKNYKRVIAATTPEGPGGPTISVFATTDYKTYVLDIQNETFRDIFYLGKSDYVNMDRNKITSADIIPTNHPMALTGLDDSYVVAKSDVYTQMESDSIQLLSIPQGAISLAGKDSNLKIFAVPITFNAGGSVGDTGNEQHQQYVDQKNNYLETADPVLVQDNTGLVYMYRIYNKLALDRGLGDYYGGAISKADFTSSPAMYDEYHYLLPDACGVSPHYTLKNVSANDLVFLAKHKLGNEYFRFKDLNHPLYQAQYYIKVSAFTAEDFKLFNGEGAVVPTFEEYVKNNPIIITKDPWGRYTAIGEDKYYIPGGCGKPVVYLYPEKSTEVSVSFAGPVELTKDIPTYANGWKVLADPSGKLTDLQPQYTNCSSIKTAAIGSEYAKEACLSNSYPYIYWAGFTTNKYPEQTTGWVVAKQDLEKVIHDKLAYIGLNAKEIQDMTEYWVPKMLAKQAPYYRISFLQTSELNQLFPMNVAPNPDTVIRVFLDWEDLAAKPRTTLPPQKLVPIVRQGFTYVEWGGLNR